MVEADKVFLVKKPTLIWGNKRNGYYYSLFYRIFVVGIWFVVLLPFLHRFYLLSWAEIIVIFVYILSLQSMLMLVNYYLKKIVSIYRKSICFILLFLLLNWFCQWIHSIVLAGYYNQIYIVSFMLLSISIFLSLQALKKIDSLNLHIEMEEKCRTSLIQNVFMASPQIERPVIIRRNKPLLFRYSKRIFKKRTPINGFIKLFIKIVLRNSYYLYSYFILINSTVWAIFLIPPIWLKIFIFFGFCFMMPIWLTTLWNKVCYYHPLMKKYMAQDAYFTARVRGVLGMFSLSLLLFILFFHIFLLFRKIIFLM